MEAEPGRRPAAEAGPDLLTILLEQREQRPRRGDGLTRRCVHALEEEAQPLLPRAVRARALEELVVGRAVLLEVERQVQGRLGEGVLGAEQERDQQPAEAQEDEAEAEDRSGGLSREEAERLLQSVRDKERRRLEELARRRPAGRAPVDKDW